MKKTHAFQLEWLQWPRLGRQNTQDVATITTTIGKHAFFSEFVRVKNRQNLHP